MLKPTIFQLQVVKTYEKDLEENLKRFLKVFSCYWVNLVGHEN